MDIADLVAFEDAGAWMYTAGDCTRAYAPEKLDWFTRQIVFIRPGTFVIFDRVKSTNPNFKKTWLLHAGKPPVQNGPDLVITNGRGRLHVQTVLPASPRVTLNQGDELYRYGSTGLSGAGGQHFPPLRKYGVETECRIEISPSVPATEDVFLHVLTATDATVDAVPRGAADVRGNAVTLRLGKATIAFFTDKVGGSITLDGRATPLADGFREAGAV
jgi:heparin/heparan-sulfate lyase